MRNIIQKVLMLAMLAIIIVALTGCGLIFGNDNIQNIRIEHGFGLEETEQVNQFKISIGMNFLLKLKWDGSENPSGIKWFKQIIGGEAVQIEGQTSAELSYKFTEYSKENIYIYAKTDKDITNKIKIELEYQEIEELTIKSNTHIIVDGDVSSVGLEEIDLFVEWEGEFYPPIEDVRIEWYRGDIPLGVGRNVIYSTSSSLNEIIEVKVIFEEKVYGSSQIAVFFRAVGDYYFESDTHIIIDNEINQNILDIKEVKLSVEPKDNELFGNEDYSYAWFVNEEQKGQGRIFQYFPNQNDTKVVIKCNVYFRETLIEELIVNINIIVDNVLVNNISIDIENGANYEKDNIYTILQSNMVYGEVALSCEINSKVGKSNSNIIWTLRNSTGTKSIARDDTVFTFVPVYGKNVVWATVDNISSKELVIYAMDDASYNNAKTAIENTFVWNSNTYSGYIIDELDLDAVIYDLLMRNDNNFKRKIYIQNSTWKPNGEFDKTKFENSLILSMNRFGFAGFYKISFTSDMELTTAVGNEMLFSQEKSPDMFVYKQDLFVDAFENTSSLKRKSLPIEDVEQTMIIKNEAMLVSALSWGIKPMFDTSSGSQQQMKMYNAAKKVLLEIINKDMTDFEKVGAIYEWIINNVNYDYYVITHGVDKVSYNAYFLEGVFEDGRAVCDGKSKAFVVMCGMEGIKSTRIVGNVLPNQEPHAWNKVLIDANGDNIREWYVVDTTWGDISRKVGNVYNERITYEYFLMQDSDIANTHTSTQIQSSAVTDLDLYKKMEFENNGEKTSFHIENQNQLDLLVEKLVAESKANEDGIIWVEIKVDEAFARNTFELDIKLKNSISTYISEYKAQSWAIDSVNNIYLVQLSKVV